MLSPATVSAARAHPAISRQAAQRLEADRARTRVSMATILLLSSVDGEPCRRADQRSVIRRLVPLVVDGAALIHPTALFHGLLPG